jgi:acyl-CoA reductase-like NAD-dependent aldehyde dehydrogenase
MAELVSLFPHDGSVVGAVGAASVADVDRAATVAASAMEDSSWRDVLPHERSRLLHRIADGIDADAERLATLQTLDCGKPIAETRGLVASAAATFRFFAAACETAQGVVTPPRGQYVALTHHVPVGVVGAITPWNSPIASEAQKVAPALAAGCAVLLKPSELTPLLALEIERIAHGAGVPPGILQVLPGDGPTVGAAIAAHPLVRRVSFTGSTATGRTIAAACSARFATASLEMGGKGAAIVFPDARRAQALAGVLYGAFGASGQACVASSRLLVHRSIAADFVRDLTSGAAALRLGDPRLPETRVGPLVSLDHRERVLGFVERAVAGGAVLRGGGKPPPDPALAAGAYMEPTVLTDVDPDREICTQEVFGPVVVVLPFDDEDEAVEIANRTPYGLSATVWSTDASRAMRLGRSLRAGTLWVNTTKQLSVAAPFGGEGDSGVGREKGVAGIRHYQAERSLFLGLDDAPLPWAGIKERADA